MNLQEKTQNFFQNYAFFGRKQEKTQNFFQNYAFFGRKSRFRGTKHT